MRFELRKCGEFVHSGKEIFGVRTGWDARLRQFGKEPAIPPYRLCRLNLLIREEPWYRPALLSHVLGATTLVVAGLMMDIFSIANSGLRAAQGMLAVSANNIANLNTPGYLTQRAKLSELPEGGVQISGIMSTGKGVDLATEEVNTIQAKTMYRANATVVKVADQMYGSLLDIMDHRVDHGDQKLDDF